MPARPYSQGGLAGPADWHERAACARPGVDLDLFYPAKGGHRQAAAAKRICAACPVAEACLADALALSERDDQGIRAGLSERDRIKLRRQRRRGAP